MLNIGPQELIIVLIIALVVVGPQRLPEMGRTIGKALREFRKIQDDVKDTLKFDLNDEPEPYVRPKKSPRTPPEPHGNGEGATDTPGSADTSAHTDTPDPIGSVGSDGGGHLGAEASSEAENDAEPRAAE
jgi:sec-independent protein translocase protein TatA